MCCNPLSAAGSCSAPQPGSAEAKAAACDCAAHPLPRGVGTAQAPYLGCGPAKTSLGHATISGILRRLRLTMGRVVRYCFGGTVGVVERYYCVGTAGELFSSHRWRCIASPSDRRQAALASTETSTASTATKSALRATKLDKLSNPPSLSPSQLTGIRPLEPTARVIERFHYFLESHHPSPCRPLPQAPGLEEDAIRPGCGPVSRFAQPRPPAPASSRSPACSGCRR